MAGVGNFGACQAGSRQVLSPPRQTGLQLTCSWASAHTLLGSGSTHRCMHHLQHPPTWLPPQHPAPWRHDTATPGVPHPKTAQMPRPTTRSASAGRARAWARSAAGQGEEACDQPGSGASGEAGYRQLLKIGQGRLLPWLACRTSHCSPVSRQQARCGSAAPLLPPLPPAVRCACQPPLLLHCQLPLHRRWVQRPLWCWLARCLSPDTRSGSHGRMRLLPSVGAAGTCDLGSATWWPQLCAAGAPGLTGCAPVVEQRRDRSAGCDGLTGGRMVESAQLQAAG